VSQIRNEKVCSAVADLRFCGLPVANSQHCRLVCTILLRIYAKLLSRVQYVTIISG